MRDYVARSRRTGRLVPIAEVPTSGIHKLLAKPLLEPSRINPGVTREAYRERLKLELEIRAMGERPS